MLNFRRVPFDWRNPIGYLVITMHQYIALKRFFEFIGFGATLGIAGVFNGMAFVHDMKTVLKLTNSSAIAGEQNDLVALKRLHEFIAFHAMLKELSVCK